MLIRLLVSSVQFYDISYCILQFVYCIMCPPPKFISKDVYTPMFTAALFMVAKTRTH